MESSNRDPDDVVLYSGLSNIPMAISWKVLGEGPRGRWVGSAKTYALTWLKIHMLRQYDCEGCASFRNAVSSCYWKQRRVAPCEAAWFRTYPGSPPPSRRSLVGTGHGFNCCWGYLLVRIRFDS